MLPFHQATKTMDANMPVATPQAIQPPYNMFYRSFQNPITLQQQNNIDMSFNSYIDHERNHNVQGYVFLAAHNTINENQFVLFSLSSSDAISLPQNQNGKWVLTISRSSIPFSSDYSNAP